MRTTTTLENDSVSTVSDYEEIPFPLMRKIYYKPGMENKVLSLSIDYKKLYEQVECWKYNQKQKNL